MVAKSPLEEENELHVSQCMAKVVRVTFVADVGLFADGVVAKIATVTAQVFEPYNETENITFDVSDASLLLLPATAVFGVFDTLADASSLPNTLESDVWQLSDEPIGSANSFIKLKNATARSLTTPVFFGIQGFARISIVVTGDISGTLAGFGVLRAGTCVLHDCLVALPTRDSNDQSVFKITNNTRAGRSAKDVVQIGQSGGALCVIHALQAMDADGNHVFAVDNKALRIPSDMQLTCRGPEDLTTFNVVADSGAMMVKGPITADGGLQCASLTTAQATITGGALNGTPVGADAPAQGHFTSVRLDPNSEDGAALTISNSANQISGDLLQVNGTAGQVALRVKTGDAAFGGQLSCTVADGSRTFHVAADTGATTVKGPIAADGGLQCTSLTTAQATITGGALNGTPVGADAPAQGHFTSVRLDPNSEDGAALTISNSATQHSGDLLQVNGTAGQVALHVKTGDVKLLGHTDCQALSAATVSAQTFVALSDARLKRDIRPISHSTIWQLLQNVRIVQYAFVRTAASAGSDRARYGVLAQDIYRIFPDLVHKDESGGMTVNYLDLFVLCIGSVQLLYYYFVGVIVVACISCVMLVYFVKVTTL